MLITFRAENFRSLRDEVELSMVLPNWVDTEHVTVPVDPASGMRVGTVAGIFGSNASGKTTVLHAMWQMSSMVLNSHQKWKPSAGVPYSPFFVAPHTTMPTVFDVDFLVAGQRYQYGFKFNRDRVIEEWLYTFPKLRPRLLFDRDVGREGEFRFGRALRGRPGIVAELTRPNSLFLSAAAANNHPQLMPLSAWFDRNFVRATPDDRRQRIQFTLKQAKEASRKQVIVALLRFADLGLEDLQFVEHEMDAEVKARVANVIKALNPEGYEEPDWREVAERTLFAHRVTGAQMAMLDLHEESDGTRAWLGLVGAVLSALETGRSLVVDELDASLHPKLTSEVVRMFHDPKVNPNGGQLIFNTHDPTLMGSLLGAAPLRRDEVWITEKGKDGATHLYSLTEFRPRKDENLERGYLQGRYGGVPFMDSEMAADAILRSGGGGRASA